MQVYPTLTSFSNGYYLVEDLLVQANDEIETPQVHEYFYELIQNNYYGDQPAPILFKHPNTEFYFDVQPTTGLPTDAMHVPSAFLEEFDVEDQHTSDELLMAKPGHASRIYSFAELAQSLAD